MSLIKLIIKPALEKTAHDHCSKNICPKCGGTETCRCSRPKTNITHNLCWVCDGRKAKYEASMGK